MSQCRSCGAKIDWIETKSGSMMPVDPEYVEYDEAEAGTVLVTDGGNIYTVKDEQNLPNVRGRISHFASCPDSKKWRKR